MNDLHLILEFRWYDMIDQGIKKEEYRELKDYWYVRLTRSEHHTVTFHRGYTKQAMTFKIRSLKVGKGKPEWGAPIHKDVFIIELGERL